MQTRRLTFETSIERIGRILASQYNIEVIFEGSMAYTDGKKVVLPFMENMSDEMVADINGYLDHEVAHCKFTNFDEIPKTINRFHKELLNACEDSRIESEMIEEYPGTSLNLEPLNTKLRGKIAEKWSEMPWPIRTMLGIRDIMDGKTPRVDADIKRYIDAAQDLAVQLRSAKSTEEVRLLTEKITKLIQKEREDEKQEDGDGDEQDGEGKSDKKSSKKPGKKGGKKGKGEKSDDASEGERSEGEGSSEGDSEGEDADGDSDSDSRGDSKGEGEDDSDSSGTGAGDNGPDEQYDGMLNEGVDEKDSEFDKHEYDLHGMMENEIREAVKEDGKPSNAKTGTVKQARKMHYGTFDFRPHYPVTTKFDEVTDYSGQGKVTDYASLKRQVMPHVSPIKRQLERVLKVRENAKWQSERERGGIDARQLAKLSSSPGYRTIFREYTKTETNNVAIELLCDMSGSMAGDRIETAKLAITALSEALKDLDIPFEVTGFRAQYSPEMAEQTRKMGEMRATSRFNRKETKLDLHVFKGFETPSLTGITKLNAGGDNPDGECVAWAAKRLAARKEKRKILMVFSDGQPSSHGCDDRRLAGDLHKKIRDIQKSGIEVIGIGIQTDCVEMFYDDNVVIENLKDLPKVVMGKLSKLITKGA